MRHEREIRSPDLLKVVKFNQDLINEKEIPEGIIVKEVFDPFDKEHPQEVVKILENLKDVSLKDIPDHLPLSRMNPIEYLGFPRQVGELFRTGFIEISLSPYVIQVLRCWEHYLLPQEFDPYSDHIELQLLNSQRKSTLRHAIQALTFVHQARIENKVVDTPSSHASLLNSVSTRAFGLDRLKVKSEIYPGFSEIVPDTTERPSRTLSERTSQDGHLIKDNIPCIHRASFRGYFIWKVPWYLYGTRLDC